VPTNSGDGMGHRNSGRDKDRQQHQRHNENSCEHSSLTFFAKRISVRGHSSNRVRLLDWSLDVSFEENATEACAPQLRPERTNFGHCLGRSLAATDKGSN
jgi:hypothetical protein